MKQQIGSIFHDTAAIRPFRFPSDADGYVQSVTRPESLEGHHSTTLQLGQTDQNSPVSDADVDQFNTRTSLNGGIEGRKNWPLDPFPFDECQLSAVCPAPPSCRPSPAPKTKYPVRPLFLFFSRLAATAGAAAAAVRLFIVSKFPSQNIQISQRLN
jgi:hypothetical protein